MKPKDFYETMYGEQQSAVSPSSSTRTTRRFELQREDAAFRFMNGGDRFLDVGCGDGKLAFLAAQKYRQIYRIDIAAPRIQRAQEKAKELGNDKFHFQLADVNEGIPFDDGYFDVASCVATLEHIFNPIELLKELYRVLKPEGQLVLVSPNVAYLPRRISAILGKPPKTSAAASFMDGGTLHYFTLRSLTLLLKQAGFSIVKRGNAGRFWFLRNQWKSLLAASFVIKAVKTNKVLNQSELNQRH